MSALPPHVRGLLATLFPPALADDIAAHLTECQAALTAAGLGSDAVERALTACLMTVERRTADAVSWERGSQHILVRARDATARCVADTRGLLLDAGIEPTDWHRHLQWEPAARPMVLDLPDPLGRLANACETRCVTACCGLDAYEVRADSLADWGRRAGLPDFLQAITQLERLSAEVAAASGPVRGHSMAFDHEWPTAADCLQYFDDWRTEATQALAEVGGAGLVRPEWRTGDVRAVAAGLAASGEFARLAVLADALEDAGCEGGPLLDHLRAGLSHGPFCWAVDLLAGR